MVLMKFKIGTQATFNRSKSAAVERFFLQQFFGFYLTLASRDPLLVSYFHQRHGQKDGVF
jgi:hypothetical protein